LVIGWRHIDTESYVWPKYRRTARPRGHRFPSVAATAYGEIPASTEFSGQH
jgi:hypothetical protein